MEEKTVGDLSGKRSGQIHTLNLLKRAGGASSFAGSELRRKFQIPLQMAAFPPTFLRAQNGQNLGFVFLTGCGVRVGFILAS